jgi:hypothetical protein
MKVNTQKIARQRRKARQKSLMEAGKKAADVVGSAQRQVLEAVARTSKMEMELGVARTSLGLVTDDLGKTRKELEVKEVLLGGLESELKEASATVVSLETERDAVQKELETVRKELDDLKQADSDARSLRNRLRSKSDEIVRLASQFRSAKSFLDSHHLLGLYLKTHPSSEDPVPLSEVGVSE